MEQRLKFDFLNTDYIQRRDRHTITLIKPHLKSLLQTIKTESATVFSNFKIEHECLSIALDGIGLHGLVNGKNQKFLHFDTAVHLEILSHFAKLKSIVNRIDKSINWWQNSQVKRKQMRTTAGKHANNNNESQSALTFGSHQRQLTLCLTEISARLGHNQTLEAILTEVLESKDLNSLLRIAKRRTAGDRTLLKCYQWLKDTEPPGYSLVDFFDDPIVAEIIVRFKNAYHTLLSLIPVVNTNDVQTTADKRLDDRDDAITLDIYDNYNDELCNADTNSTTTGTNEEVKDINRRSSRFNGNLSGQLNNNKQFLTSVKNCKSLKNRHPKSWSTSETDLHRTTINKKYQFIPSLSSQKSSRSVSKSLFSLTADNTMYRRDGNNYKNGNENDISRSSDNFGNRMHDRLSSGFMEARLRSYNQNRSQMNDSDFNMPIDSLFVPEPDYPQSEPQWSVNEQRHSSAVLSCHSHYAQSSVIYKYSNLFANERTDIMAQLNLLPEFAALEDLQIKTMLSVIILTYRSVYEKVENRRKQVWNVLNADINDTPSNDFPLINGCQSDETRRLDAAIYAYLYRKAKTQHGMSNAKEVTAQIWKALYDFPSLKTCTRFNRFILDCVSVVWDMVSGAPDGNSPRYRLDYESSEFDSEKHLRFHRSSLRSDTIKRYVWPALVQLDTNRIVHKAIVIT